MSDTVAELVTLQDPWARRKARIDKLYVQTPDIVDALDRIKAFRTNGYRGPDGTATCFLVSGPTNAGKSRLFTSFCDRLDAQEDGERIPVVRIRVPTPFNIRDLLAELLIALRTKDFATSHKLGQMQRRVVAMLHARQTELIMMDDTQHIIDKKGGNTPYWAADMLKTLILDGAKVPIVFNGLAVTEEIFEQNTQLKSRRRGIVRLAPDGWYDDPVGREQFKLAVSWFERAANFPQLAQVGAERLALDSDQVAERIWHATDGLRGNLHGLFSQAAELGTKQEANALTLQLLAEAHAILSDAGPGWKNVFTVDVLPSLVKQDDSRLTKLHKPRRAA